MKLDHDDLFKLEGPPATEPKKATWATLAGEIIALLGVGILILGLIWVAISLLRAILGV